MPIGKKILYGTINLPNGTCNLSYTVLEYRIVIILNNYTETIKSCFTYVLLMYVQLPLTFRNEIKIIAHRKERT